MAYAFLTNKKQSTYEELFRMINRSITNVQRSFNCDFEKAVFNAARKVFGSDLCIYGCYFQLAQNIQKSISKYDLLTTFYSSEDFRTNTQF